MPNYSNHGKPSSNAPRNEWSHVGNSYRPLRSKIDRNQDQKTEDRLKKLEKNLDGILGELVEHLHPGAATNARQNDLDVAKDFLRLLNDEHNARGLIEERTNLLHKLLTKVKPRSQDYEQQNSTRDHNLIMRIVQSESYYLVSDAFNFLVKLKDSLPSTLTQSLSQKAYYTGNNTFHLTGLHQNEDGVLNLLNTLEQLINSNNAIKKETALSWLAEPNANGQQFGHILATQQSAESCLKYLEFLRKHFVDTNDIRPSEVTKLMTRLDQDKMSLVHRMASHSDNRVAQKSLSLLNSLTDELNKKQQDQKELYNQTLGLYFNDNANQKASHMLHTIAKNHDIQSVKAWIDDVYTFYQNGVVSAEDIQTLLDTKNNSPLDILTEKYSDKTVFGNNARIERNSKQWRTTFDRLSLRNEQIGDFLDQDSTANQSASMWLALCDKLPLSAEQCQKIGKYCKEHLKGYITVNQLTGYIERGAGIGEKGTEDAMYAIMNTPRIFSTGQTSSVQELNEINKEVKNYTSHNMPKVDGASAEQSSRTGHKNGLLSKFKFWRSAKAEQASNEAGEQRQAEADGQEQAQYYTSDKEDTSNQPSQKMA